MRTSDLLDLMASLAEAPEVDELWRRLYLTAGYVGFDHALVGMQIQIPTMSPIWHVISGWPKEYQLLYAKRDYLHLDPAVAHCLRSTDPLIWTPEIYHGKSTEILEESRRFGLCHGLSVAVHGVSGAKSMLSLARHQYFDPGAPETQTFLSHARLLATCIHMALERLLVPELLRREYPVKLTARESEILQYLARGKGSEVIGNILGRSTATVEFHVKNLLRKLGVASRPQGVLLAVALGLIR